jgi:hypothetical protein
MMKDDDVKRCLERIQSIVRGVRRRGLADDVHPLRAYALGLIEGLIGYVLEEPPRFPSSEDPK